MFWNNKGVGVWREMSEQLMSFHEILIKLLVNIRNIVRLCYLA